MLPLDLLKIQTWLYLTWMFLSGKKKREKFVLQMENITFNKVNFKIVQIFFLKRASKLESTRNLVLKALKLLIQLVKLKKKLI